jgi:hypothetical protein
MYFEVKPRSFEVYNEAVDGIQTGNLYVHPNDAYIQTGDSTRTYLLGVGLGSPSGTGVLGQVSRSTDGSFSRFRIQSDNIAFEAWKGQITLDSLMKATNMTNKDIMVWDSVSLYWQHIPVSSLSVGSVPISGLTAATVANSIDNLNYTQTWDWSTLSGGGILLTSSSTAATGNGQGILGVVLQGTNSNSGQITSSSQFINDHAGTGADNRAITASTSNGTIGRAIYASGSSAASGTAYGIDAVASATSGTAYGGRFYASGGTNKYSIGVGLAGTQTGNILFTGTTSGGAILTVDDAAGSPTLKLPKVTGTLVQYVDGTTASSSTPTPTGDARQNNYSVTALATNPTFGAPSGTPINFNILLIRIKDDGTARTLAWNAIYRASTDFALPTTTVISKTMYVYFTYNSADSKWDCVGLTQGF